MTTAPRRYASYRPCKAGWLGTVPSHWKTKRLKFAASCNDDVLRETTAPDTILHYVDISSVSQQRGIERIEEIAFDEAPSRARRRVKEGDTILSTVRTYLKAVAHIDAGTSHVTASTGFAVIRPKGEVEGRYLSYQVQSEPFVAEVVRRSVGVSYPAINAADVMNFGFALPPPDEQRAIAAFLDRETARIDALIEKKRRLIELLQERRAAVIFAAVTKGLWGDAARAAGLDPRPTFEPSGVDWIGDVPAHWEVGNLRRFAVMKTGHTPSRIEPDYWEDCDIPWFTLADVWQLRDGTRIWLGETKERISRLGLANSAAELLPAGTVVFSRTASVGFSGIMPVPMATTQDFWNWIPGPKLTPEFLLYQFRAMTQEFEKLTMGSTHKTIYQADAAGICVGVPPIREQRAIVDFLQRETTRIDGLVAKVVGVIERLSEYRSALISAAVIGQIDVREAA